MATTCSLQSSALPPSTFFLSVSHTLKDTPWQKGPLSALQIEPLRTPVLSHPPPGAVRTDLTPDVGLWRWTGVWWCPSHPSILRSLEETISCQRDLSPFLQSLAPSAFGGRCACTPLPGELLCLCRGHL